MRAFLSVISLFSDHNLLGINRNFGLYFGKIHPSVQQWHRHNLTASGFVFRDFDSRGLEHALGRALDAHADVATWQQLVTSVMQQDWSWDASARKYLELYEQIRSRPPAPPPEPAA